MLLEPERHLALADLAYMLERDDTYEKRCLAYEFFNWAKRLKTAKRCDPSSESGKPVHSQLKRPPAEAGGFAGSRLKPDLVCGLFANSEVIIWLRQVLGLDILHDYLIRHISTTGNEEPSRPDMPAPARSPQRLVLLQQAPRCLSFDPLHQLARRYVRRNRHEQVDMVPTDVPLENFDLQLRTNLPRPLPNRQGNFTCQQRFAVLRNPHKM